MKKIYCLAFLLHGFLLFSQEQASNWYFGENAGIRFNANGSITVLNDGLLNTREGCSSISDGDGNLLFYTDGSLVYNKNHTLMQNGSGLLGDQSSTQSAIVIPKPEDPNTYYIFTVGTTQSQRGLYYSIVDMTLDNGLGAITQKNINLLNRCSEKISAVLQDCESGALWVIAFSNLTGVFNSNQERLDTFHAFEVTSAGVNPTSVTSNFANLVVTEARGYLKLSPDGTKLAVANVGDGLMLYDFDSQTGIVSNQTTLTINNQVNKPYGIEFSPDNNLLYVSASNDYFPPSGTTDTPEDHRSVLIQFNLNAANIVASQVLIDDRQLYRGGLQLGPDGKIYRALSATYSLGLPFLGVINSPNTLGTGCNYVHNAVNLGGNNSTQGLPPFIQSFFNQKIDIIRNGNPDSTYLPLCDGDTYTLVADDIPGATYTWTFNNTPLPETDFDLEINQPGLYEVLIDLNTGDCETLEGEALVEYFTIPDASDAVLFQCDEDGIPDERTLFNLYEAFDTLTLAEPDRAVRFFESAAEALNNNGEIDGNVYQNLSNPQTLYVQVINTETNCFEIVELTLEVSVTQLDNHIANPVCDELGSEDGINTFSDFQEIENSILNQVPAGIDLTFYTSYNDALLEQNEIQMPYTNSNPYQETLFVRAENNNRCYGISEVLLTINTLPSLEEDLLVYYCLNAYPETITLTSGLLDNNTQNYTYLWSTGEQTESIEINEPGIYTVTVTSTLTGCSKQRTLTVEASNIATIENIAATDASSQFNNNVTITVSGEGTYQFALDNPEQNIYLSYQDENNFQNVFPGIYTVLVKDLKNNCGIVQQTLSVIGFPQYFTPNNDGYNDTWQVYGLSEQFQPESKIYIFDQYGKLLKQLDPKTEGWDGTFNGKPLPNNDYWFEVTLQDGRVFKSHFSLKR